MRMMKNRMTMGNKQLENISIADINRNNDFCGIDDDLILFDSLSGIPLPSSPCRCMGIIVGLCLRGSISYTVDTESYVVNPGQVILLHEGQVISSCRRDDALMGIGLMMSPSFFQEIVKGVHEMSTIFLFSRSHPVSSLQPDEEQSMTDYFRLIRSKMADGGNHFRKDVARMLLAAMVYDMSNAIYRIQQSSYRKQTRAEEIFTDFIGLVKQNYRHERRVSWYGEQLCITAKYLSEAVKQASSRTPNDWIDNYVTMELRVLLKNTSKSIKEIAHEMNFSNQSFMGKYFKEHVGMSPLTYRKS